jgi:hypothetical protein
MNCYHCHGSLEYTPNGQTARCRSCRALYQVQGNQLTPIQVQAPGGGHNPEFNEIFAQKLGFPPSNPGPQHHGSSARVGVKIGGVGIGISGSGLSVDEDKLKKKVTKKIEQKAIGCVIGLVITGCIVIGMIGMGVYIYLKVDDALDADSSTAKAKIESWNGKSTYSCSTGSHIIKNTKASLTKGTAIKASGNCTLTLIDVDIKAPIGISAAGNAKVTLQGGTLEGTNRSILGEANAKITVEGTKVIGSHKTSANAKVIGI